VQNLSGEDWSKVKLVLVAGAPLAFQSTLGDPVVPPRPVVTDSGEQVVMMPLNEFNSWKETLYLQATPSNAAHLQRSIAEADQFIESMTESG